MSPEDLPSVPDSAARPHGILFALSLATLLASRLFRLADFPIYFFCDEAVQQVRAWELLRDGLRDQFHQLLPTYFRNGEVFNLSTSVYAQVLPVLAFGRSVFLTRAVSALIACSAAVAVCLTLRNVFRIRFWWTGALLLGITPAWFLHSRTAFETAMAVSFFSWALYFYLRYRGAGRAHSSRPCCSGPSLSIRTVPCRPSSPPPLFSSCSSISRSTGGTGDTFWRASR